MTRLRSTLLALAAAAACGAPPRDAPAPRDVAARSAGLLGATRYGDTCSDTDKAFLDKALRYGRTAAASNAFAQCMDRAVKGTYRQCSGDPYFGADAQRQLDAVMTAARSSVDLAVQCAGATSGNARAGIGEWGQLGPETLTFSSWLQAVNAPGDAKGPWPWSQAAGIVWHEAMHQQGYTHGGDDQASAKKACGYEGWSDADWHFQRNTLPYLVGDCISTVLERSGERCGAPLDAAGNALNLVTDYDGATCAPVADPQQASVAWRQTGWPRDAARVAACTDGRLYAQNFDRSVWVSRQDGADGTWTWVTTPGGAQQIFCAGDTLWAFNDDRTLWRNDGDDANVRWTYVGKPWAAKQVVGTTVLALFLPAPSLYALNDDNTLWRSSTGEDGSWTYVGKPWAASRIAAGGGLLEARPFALNTDRTLWLNSGDGCDAYWHYVDFPFAAAEITASSMFTLYALNDDRTLWKGEVKGSDLLSSVAFGRPRRCDGNTLVP